MKLGGILLLTVLLLATATYSQTFSPADGPPQRKPLTNADVVMMVKSGLKESTILAVIEQNSTAFDTSPAALIEAKNNGVPTAVIEAMVRSTAPVPVSATAATPAVARDDATILAEGTYYKGPTGWVKLQPQMMSGGGATHVAKVFVPGMTPHMVFTFRGAESPVQIRSETGVLFQAVASDDEYSRTLGT